MIRVQNMTYSYERNISVLQDITLIESEPVITGLWGRNGAGKTTLMKLLAGHLRPNQGSVEIMGMAPYNNEQAVQHVCFMQEEHLFGWLWTVRDALRFGSYYNPNWNPDTAQRLLEIFKLDERKKVVKLSKGMKTALQYMIGLSSHAAITILDEPINGLDAAMRKKLYETLLESHTDHPRLIMISTHHIEELQTLFETLVVLKNGKLLIHEPIDTIREGGVWLAGGKNKVEEAITGRKVLERSEVGSMVKVMIDAPFSSEWKELAQKQGLSIEKAKMQDYLLNITCGEEVTI
jgi:ABC-2 type transport system ATP-binding protein